MDCSKLDEKIIVEIHKTYPDFKLNLEIETERLFICIKCWKLIEKLKKYKILSEHKQNIDDILNDIMNNKQNNLDILKQYKKQLNLTSKNIELEKDFS